MRTISLIATISVALYGCYAGPRPFDGNIGYRASAINNGQVAISVIEERSKPVEKEKLEVIGICSAILARPASGLALTVKRSIDEEISVDMSLLVPTAAVDSGDSTSVGSSGTWGHSGSATVQHPNSSAEKVIRTLKVRNSEYLCSENGKSSP